jgi:methylamine dehydrogenase accessory protein MauD
MVDALIVSNVLLWIAVVVLAGVVWALLRQIGLLHERVAPAGALVPRGGPVVGTPAPAIEVTDWHDRALRVGAPDPEGRSTLLFFLSPTCPVCKTLLPVLASIERAEREWLRVVLASDGPRTEHEDFVREHELDGSAYVLSTPLGLAYRVGQLPHAVLVDERGIVRSQGLVNSREHIESLFEAMERGVASVQEYLAKKGGDRQVA